MSVHHLRITGKKPMSAAGDLTAMRDTKSDLGEAALALVAAVATSRDVLVPVVLGMQQQKPLLLCQSRFFARS